METNTPGQGRQEDQQTQNPGQSANQPVRENTSTPQQQEEREEDTLTTERSQETTDEETSEQR